MYCDSPPDCPGVYMRMHGCPFLSVTLELGGNPTSEYLCTHVHCAIVGGPTRACIYVCGMSQCIVCVCGNEC